MSRSEWLLHRMGLSVSADPPHAPGLLLIQVDGLSREQFERALARRRMPFVRRLLQRHGYELHTHYSGIPSSTPAVQAELFYGVRTAVPAFAFLDRATGKIAQMTWPQPAKRIEAKLAARSEGLLRGGSSWSNIYTGGAGAEESHFCAANIGLGDLWSTVTLRTFGMFVVLHLGSLLRVLALMGLEVGLGLRDACRGVFFQGRSWWRELAFLFARVLVSVGLRETITLGVEIDLARGLPVTQVNFLGYDEHSHRRGPQSLFAHWTLHGIDRCVRRLYRAARRSGRRDYDVWIFSDHGQTAVKQARHLAPGGLEGLVRKHWPAATPAAENAPVRQQHRTSPGHWLGGPRAARREARHESGTLLSRFESEEFAVAALGPVGHVYFNRALDAAATRELASALVRDGVPGVMLRRADGRVDFLLRSGTHVLPDEEELFPHDPAIRKEVARDLVALCYHEQAGDLVVLGWAPDSERWTFADENGAHAGPSPQEVQAFALVPSSTWLPPEAKHHLRPELLRRAALHLLGRDPRARPARTPVHVNGTPRTQLRVVTYNAHGCLGLDGRVTPARIARVLDRFGADVIALQELDAGRSRSRAEDQLELIAAELGMHATYCPAIDAADGRYGHGILSREPIELVRRGRLPRHSRVAEPREALWVKFPWSGRAVHLIGTHLGLGAGERALQVEQLFAPNWLGELDGHEPIILCGDFNLHPGSRAYRRLTQRLHDVQAHAPEHVAQKTFPSFLPVRRIDHIFVSAHFQVVSVAVPRDALTTRASDHLPLVADLVWKK